MVTPESPQTDLCECGHGLEVHGLVSHHGSRCFSAGCPCTAYRPTPEPLCKCGHEVWVHLIDTSLRHVCVPDCLCTAYRPATPSTEATAPQPDGLVERVAEQIAVNGHPSTIEERAAAAALAVADWLDETFTAGTYHIAAVIRHEVGVDDT